MVQERARNSRRDLGRRALGFGLRVLGLGFWEWLSQELGVNGLEGFGDSNFLGLGNAITRIRV